MEDAEAENGRFWCRNIEPSSWGTLDAAKLAIQHIERMGGGKSRVGVELAFIPADAMDALRAGLPNCRFLDAHLPLERLRAVKSPKELEHLREASERVVASMLATFAAVRPGMTKHEVTARLRQEERNRGLSFEYCLITAGTGLNRAPSDQALKAGDIMSLDSGGQYKGYIGDLCRMGIAGEPDAELEDLLGWVESIQQLARKPIRASMIGREVFDVVAPALGGFAARGQCAFRRARHGHHQPRGAAPHRSRSGDLSGL